MKRINNRIVGVMLVFAVAIGFVGGTTLYTKYKDNKMEAYAFKQENEDDVSIGYCMVENALFPINELSISQIAYEEANVGSHTGASHGGLNAIDNANGYTTPTLTFNAPFSGRIVDFDYDNCNAFVFESNEMVRLPYYNEPTKCSVLVLHSDDIDNVINNNDGQYPEYSQTEMICHEGNAHGYNDIHFELRVIKGSYHSPMWQYKATENGCIAAYEAFYVNTNYSSVIKTGHLESGNHLTDYRYGEDWSDKWTYSNETHSKLRVWCSNSLAFEEEYGFFDFLFEKSILDETSKLITIQNIVNNYTSLNYSGLSDFEKKVYDSCRYEWVEINDEPEEIVEDPKETKTISFYDQFKSAPFEQRESIVGEPLGDLPIISNNDIPDVAQNIRPKHIGWKQYFGKEMITEEFIMPDQDLKLYAVYDDDLTIITLTTAETTTIVTTQTESANNSNNSSGGGRHDNDVTDQPIDNEISIATTTVHIEPRVEYVTGTTPWSEWTYTPIARNNSNIVQEKEVTEQKLKGYRMVTYTTKSLDGTRISDKVDINDEYETKGRSRIYNQYHYEWDYTLAEVEGAPIIKYGETQGGEMASYNYSSTKEDGFALAYGPYTYIFFKKEPLYETVTRKMYRSCQITSTPVYS